MISLFKKLMPREDEFFDLFERHARTVQGAADAMRDIFGGQGDLEAHCRKIVDLENEADDALNQALATLYDEATDIPSLVTCIHWGEIYGLLEDATDRAEDVADVLEGIYLKHG